MQDLTPRPLIETPHLRLVASEPAMAAAVREFNLRNRAHFVRWDPPHGEDFFALEARRRKLQQDAGEFAAGAGWRWWLMRPDDASRIEGFVHFSQVHRGPFCNAMLGYGIDAALQGRGLMHEAVAAAIDEVFSPRVNLHRVQANVLPDNARSLALLERLGFEREGLAPNYLFIDGRWRDHVLTARINAVWRA